jgi:hypothetical protein
VKLLSFALWKKPTDRLTKSLRGPVAYSKVKKGNEQAIRFRKASTVPKCGLRNEVE